MRPDWKRLKNSESKKLQCNSNINHFVEIPENYFFLKTDKFSMGKFPPLKSQFRSLNAPFHFAPFAEHKTDKIHILGGKYGESKPNRNVFIHNLFSFFFLLGVQYVFLDNFMNWKIGRLFFLGCLRCKEINCERWRVDFWWAEGIRLTICDLSLKIEKSWDAWKDQMKIKMNLQWRNCCLSLKMEETIDAWKC